MAHREILIHVLNGYTLIGSSKPNFPCNLYLGIHYFTVDSDKCDVVSIFGERVLDLSACYHWCARNSRNLDFDSISEQHIFNFFAANAFRRAIQLQHLLKEM